MSFLKHHLSLIIPLVALLFIYQFFTISDRILKDHQEKINSNYSIIIASERDLEKSEIEDVIESIKDLEEIEPDSMLSRLKGEISDANLALLKMELPKFYRITLLRFPDEKFLDKIKVTLEKVNGVKRVETFAKSHNRVYRLLILNKSISKILAILIFVISFLLMIKQIELWRFEHMERMEIMGLFGASYWMRSALLFRLALVDSIIATAITSYFYYYLQSSNEVNYLTSDLGIDSIPFSLLGDTITLLSIALFISFVSVFMVTIRHRG